MLQMNFYPEILLPLFQVNFLSLRKESLKQWLSTMLSISTKQTTTSHIKSLNIKILWHMMLEIKVLAWDRNKNVAGLNRLMGSHPPLLIILITLIKGQRYLPICTPILTKVFTCLYTYIDLWWHLHIHTCKNNHHPISVPQNMSCLCIYTNL